MFYKDFAKNLFSKGAIKGDYAVYMCLSGNISFTGEHSSWRLLRPFRTTEIWRSASMTFYKGTSNNFSYVYSILLKWWMLILNKVKVSNKEFCTGRSIPSELKPQTLFNKSYTVHKRWKEPSWCHPLICMPRFCNSTSTRKLARVHKLPAKLG